MQDYRRLRVWKKAFALALNVRRATHGFPRTGYAELKAQILSAAESLLINIIEGCGASTQKEFARFLQISIKSSMELEGELQLAHGYGILPERDWRSVSTQTIDTRRMLCGLRNKVLGTDPSRSIGSSQTDSAKPETHPPRPGGEKPIEPPATPPVPETTTGDAPASPVENPPAVLL